MRWPVDAVGAAELERVEDAGQHPPVVVGVGPADLLADLVTKQLLAGLGLLDQLAQRRLRDDRVERGADGLVGMIDRGAGECEQ
jgi:hypothetical protein